MSLSLREKDIDYPVEVIGFKLPKVMFDLLGRQILIDNITDIRGNLVSVNVGIECIVKQYVEDNLVNNPKYSMDGISLVDR